MDAAIAAHFRARDIAAGNESEDRISIADIGNIQKTYKKWRNDNNGHVQRNENAKKNEIGNWDTHDTKPKINGKILGGA